MQIDLVKVPKRRSVIGKLFPAWRGGLVVALVVGVAGCKPTQLKAAVGDDLFAIADDQLLELTYRTPAARVTAQRFVGTAAFQLSRATAAGEFEHCQGGPLLDEALKELGSLRVAARLPSQPVGAVTGELLIYGPTLMEPFHAGVLPQADGGALGLSVYGTAYQVSARQKTLDVLLTGCAALGQK